MSPRATAQARPKGQLRIGISGWRYPGWRGTFYPEGLAQRRELAFASQRLNSIEINGSFYSLQTPENYERWYAETPPGFVFSVKGSRFITHMKRLRDIEVPLGNFFGSGVLALQEKLGPFLWQFPPSMPLDMDRFSAFFGLLPKNTDEAIPVAQQHDHRLKTTPYTKVAKKRRLRHAVEIRHASFLTPEFIALLRHHNIAFVIADTAGHWPYAEDITADFVYCRLHGDTELYASGYMEAALQNWAQKIRHWGQGTQVRGATCIAATPARARNHRDVYVYFDNDAKVHAPYDAIRLAEMLNV